MTRRTDKIAHTLQAHLADLVNHHLADPRVDRMVTIGQVEVSPDLRHATVPVTALGASEAQQRNVVRALQHAAGRLQRLLADRVQLRLTPRLHFRLDEQALRARATLEAIEQAVRSNRPVPPDDQTAASETAEP